MMRSGEKNSSCTTFMCSINVNIFIVMFRLGSVDCRLARTFPHGIGVPVLPINGKYFLFCLLLFSLARVYKIRLYIFLKKSSLRTQFKNLNLNYIT